MTGKHDRPRANWVAIEREYGAGQVSLRDNDGSDGLSTGRSVTPIGLATSFAAFWHPANQPSAMVRLPPVRPGWRASLSDGPA